VEHDRVIRWRGEVVARLQSDNAGKFCTSGIHPEIFERPQEGYSFEVDGNIPSAIYPSSPLNLSNAIPSVDLDGNEVILVPFAILIQ